MEFSSVTCTALYVKVFHVIKKRAIVQTISLKMCCNGINVGI